LNYEGKTLFKCYHIFPSLTSKFFCVII